LRQAERGSSIATFSRLLDGVMAVSGLFLLYTALR
jgi:hypothetical protein